MEETKMVVLAVVIAIVAAAAILTGIDVYLALKTAKAASGRKPGYFNIGYKPETGTKFYRAHLVGKAARIDNKVLYVVEIHPEDAAKARVEHTQRLRGYRRRRVYGEAAHRGILQIYKT